MAAVAWLAIGVGAPAMALLVWRVNEAPRAASIAPARHGRRRAESDGSVRRAIAEIASNRPFMRLLAGWFVNGLANGLPAVLFPLYLQHALGAGPVASGVLIMAYFVAGVARHPRMGRAQPPVRQAPGLVLGDDPGVRRLHLGAAVAARADRVVLRHLRHDRHAALGADLALPPAMQADVIDFDRLRTGQERAGLFFALWSMSTKLALALAVGLAFPALSALGFVAGADNDPDALLWLAVIYAGAPSVLKAVCHRDHLEPSDDRAPSGNHPPAAGQTA